MIDYNKNLLLVYNNVLELRKRLSPDGDGSVYEDDHLLLDKILDLLEDSMFLHHFVEKMINKEGV